MGRPKNAEIREEKLQGFKYFTKLLPVLEQLHEHRCDRDTAGNRQLHYDQYIALILLYFFNPILTSLRGIQQASELKKVQRLLGCPRAALGSLSEAARVFDAELLRGIIGDLVEKLPAIHPNTDFTDLQRIITLVDGSVLPALPKMVEAMWRQQKHRGFRLHTHFELLRGVPTRMDVTPQHVDERQVLKACLQPDRLYVLDSGYVAFDLFRRILEIGSSFVCRIYDHMLFEVVESRPVTPEAQAVNVIRDRVVRFSGPSAAKAGFDHRMRIVEVKCKPHQKRGGRPGQGGPNQGESLQIATDVLDAPAEVIALVYKQRWSIETFFRFFKHVLGCRHLLSHAPNGIEIQTYVAIIACLLISLWTGRKPTLRTYEMICYCFTGLASEDELLAHIKKLQPQA